MCHVTQAKILLLSQQGSRRQRNTRRHGGKATASGETNDTNAETHSGEEAAQKRKRAPRTNRKSKTARRGRKGKPKGADRKRTKEKIK